MNTDMRISTGVMGNRKIRRLIRAKGAEGFVQLITLWIYTSVHRPTGVLDDMDEFDIQDAAKSYDEKFADVLFDLKLLDFDDGTYSIHNWKKHNPWAFEADKRSEIARNAAKARWANQRVRRDKQTQEKQ